MCTYATMAGWQCFGNVSLSRAYRGDWSLSEAQEMSSCSIMHSYKARDWLMTIATFCIITHCFIGYIYWSEVVYRLLLQSMTIQGENYLNQLWWSRVSNHYFKTISTQCLWSVCTIIVKRYCQTWKDNCSVSVLVVTNTLPESGNLPKTGGRLS